MPLTFGLTDTQIKRRKLADRRQKDKNKSIVDDLINKIQNNTENDGWLPISVQYIQKKYNIIDNVRIVYINNSIKRYPNIISSITQKEKCTCYKYVDVERKKDLLFQSFKSKYDNLEAKDIELLNKIYINDNIDVCYINDILICYQYLKKAKADKNWVNVNMMTFINRKMIPVDDFLFALNSLYEHKLFAYKRINDKETCFHLTISDNFDDMQNDNNNDATIINSINNIANNSNNDIASIPLEDKFISLKNQINTFFNEYKEVLQDSIQKEQTENTKSYSVLVKLQNENEQLSQQIKNLKKQYIEQQKRLEFIKEYNYKFQKNTFELLEDMIGQSINLISDFARNPRYTFSDQNKVNRFKGNLVQTISETVSEIKKYNPESKYPEQKEIK